MKIELEYYNPTKLSCGVRIKVDDLLVGSIYLPQKKLFSFEHILLHGIQECIDSLVSRGSPIPGLNPFPEFIPGQLASECIIKGCALYDEDQSRFLWGDLFRMGSVLILNGVTDGGKAAWQYEETLPNVMKTLVVNKGAPYFERRGVVTVMEQFTTFNKAAAEYIATSPVIVR